MNFLVKKMSAIYLILVFTLAPVFVFAQESININAQNLLAKSEIFISPRNATFLVGSTFEAPIYIDTKGSNINAIDLKINFDPAKLSIVNPSGGKSIFGIWVEPPKYDNRKGTASLAGVVPSPGIVTSSGLIITITFKVLSSGTTRVTISDNSSANLNDGLGSEVLLAKSGATYNLVNRAPDGVNIYSETHPSQDSWYNNNSPIFSWDKNADITGFSVFLDNTAGTIPASTITHKDASVFYEAVKDGITYLHVKSFSKGVWGATSHFAVRIDTLPPASFKIGANSFKDENGMKKYMASFFTTDTMSGVSHYEVGVINKNSIGSASPVFVETESPYLVPMDNTDSTRVIVRAYDNAGNVTESYVDLYPGYSFMQLFKKFGLYIAFILLGLVILELILHYLFGHHILDNIRKTYRYFRNINQNTSGDESQK